jgi:hypothetical protein
VQLFQSNWEPRGHKWISKGALPLTFCDRWLAPSLGVGLTVSLFIWAVMSKQKKSPQNVMVVSGNERGHLREHFLLCGMIPVVLLSSQFHFIFFPMSLYQRQPPMQCGCHKWKQQRTVRRTYPAMWHHPNFVVRLTVCHIYWFYVQNGEQSENESGQRAGGNMDLQRWIMWCLWAKNQEDPSSGCR